jgi:hypothetical protein
MIDRDTSRAAVAQQLADGRTSGSRGGAGIAADDAGRHLRNEKMRLRRSRTDCSTSSVVAKGFLSGPHPRSPPGDPDDEV